MLLEKLLAIVLVFNRTLLMIVIFHLVTVLPNLNLIIMLKEIDGLTGSHSG